MSFFVIVQRTHVEMDFEEEASGSTSDGKYHVHSTGCTRIWLPVGAQYVNQLTDRAKNNREQK